jgi:hypothetical protein
VILLNSFIAGFNPVSVCNAIKPIGAAPHVARLLFGC